MHLHHRVHSGDHLVQAIDPVVEQLALAAQVRQRVHVRVVEEGRDLLEGEAQLAVEQHPVQTLDVGAGVAAVTRGRAARRHHEAYLVLVVPRSHADPDDPADLAHRPAPAHPGHGGASRRVRVKHRRRAAPGAPARG